MHEHERHENSSQVQTRPTQRALDPRKSTETTPALHQTQCGASVVVGLLPVGTACAFSSSLRGSKLVPSKWRCLVPPTSPHQGATPRVPRRGHAGLTPAVRRQKPIQG
jgi:hypothetical protein